MKRPYYVLKAKTELERLIKFLMNKFNLSELEAIMQLEDALNDIHQEAVLREGKTICPNCGEAVEPIPSEVEYYHGGAKRVVVSEKCPNCGEPL